MCAEVIARSLSITLTDTHKTKGFLHHTRQLFAKVLSSRQIVFEMELFS